MEKEFAIKLLTKTWTRDSHGLYDYESHQVKPQEGTLVNNAIIVRKKMDIKILKSFQDKKDDEEFLCEIKMDNECNYTFLNPVSFELKPSEENINLLQNKIWYVLPSDENTANNLNNSNNNYNVSQSNEDYYINLNDIIKLGRVKYSVNEVFILNNTSNNNSNKLNSSSINNKEQKEKTYDIQKLNDGTLPLFDFIYEAECPQMDSEEIQCKICYSSTNEESNPLVNLCNVCTGGIKYSHFSCLKLWMQTKLSVKESIKKNVKSYNIKQYNCEICKTPYPFRFSVGANVFDLIEIKRPANKNYIILESLNQKKDNNNLKSIHVILFDDEQKITLGRGHESDVRINDISVSRLHAALDFNNGRIRIRDLKSKFGSLVLVKNDLQIKSKIINLQIGRTYVQSVIVLNKEITQKQNKKEKVINSFPTSTSLFANISNNFNFLNNNNNKNTNKMELLSISPDGNLNKFLSFDDTAQINNFEDEIMKPDSFAENEFED